MKAKLPHFGLAILPALIVVPTMIQAIHAGSSKVIDPDPAGNVTVTSDFTATNGTDWTVRASGGSTPPFTVDIEAGAILTGNSCIDNAVVITAPEYTINNRGTLDASNIGILSNTSSSIINNQNGGIIRGGYSGISYGYGDYDKQTSDYDEPPSSGSVINYGSISGNAYGIYGGTELNINNSKEGTITGESGYGIYTGDNLLLDNAGSITGVGGNSRSPLGSVPIYKNSGIGVFADDNATITNSGSITGETGNGIYTYNDLTLTNSGTITGKGYLETDNGEVAGTTTASIASPYNSYGSGVNTGNNAVILNKAGGVIQGYYDGISAGTSLELENFGIITGSYENKGHAGVNAGDGARIINRGEIYGDQYGIIIRQDDCYEKYSTGENGGETPLESMVTNYGTITGTNGIGVNFASYAPQTLDNHGTINGGDAAIVLQGGGDIVNLRFGSTVKGDIHAGSPEENLNFFSGAVRARQRQNMVHGNVYGFGAINKSESGFAFIGAPGESFDVVTNAINISGGGLVINGNLSGFGQVTETSARTYGNVNGEAPKTFVKITNGGTLDGTGLWNADISLGDGGISAGAIDILLNGGRPPTESALPATKGVVEPAANDAVGTLTLIGSVAQSLEYVTITPPDGPLPAARTSVLPPVSSSHIRVDIIPQTRIRNGINSDLIVQNGAGNTFDLTGVGIRIAPTNINRTLTEGRYTIVDSDSPLLGVKDLGPVGVLFSPTAVEKGPFRATESGENNQNTVLTRYFTTVETEDPVGPVVVAKSGKLAAAVVQNDPNDSNLLINIQHDFEGLPGLSSTEARIGSVLDRLVTSSNPLIQDFIAALDYSDLATVQATLASLDPSATLGLVTSVVNSNYRLHRQTQEHLAAIRGSGRQVSVPGASSKDAKGGLVPGEPSSRTIGRGNAWGSLSYDGQDFESPNSTRDFDGDAGAFTAGVDWLIAPQFVLGIVFDGSSSDLDGDGFNSDVDSFRGAVYGTWGASHGFYSDFLLGFGDHDLDSKRRTAGLLSGSANSDTDATSFQALWTVGYTFRNDQVKHGPFAGFEYQNVDVDGFTQSGLVPIEVDGYEIDSFRALIGYRVNARYEQFMPYASIAYAHEFEDGETRTTARLGGQPFSVSGAELSSAVLITVGTGYAINDALTMDIGYRGEIATDDGLTSHGGSLGLNYAF